MKRKRWHRFYLCTDHQMYCLGQNKRTESHRVAGNKSDRCWYLQFLHRKRGPIVGRAAIMDHLREPSVPKCSCLLSSEYILHCCQRWRDAFPAYGVVGDLDPMSVGGSRPDQSRSPNYHQKFQYQKPPFAPQTVLRQRLASNVLLGRFVAGAVLMMGVQLE